VAVLALLGAVACGESSNFLADLVGSDPEQAQAAIETGEFTSLEAALLAAIVDGADLDSSEVEIAESRASMAIDTFSPSTCVTAFADSGVVTYQFDGCSGPFGLSQLEGTAVATFPVPGMDSVAINLTGTGLEVAGIPFTMNTTADYSEDDGARDLAVQTSGGGVASSGEILTRAGSYLAEWTEGDSCFVVDGTWTTTIDLVNYTTVAIAYSRCGSRCPADGGRIVFTELVGEQDGTGTAVTVTFDGDDGVNYLSSDGGGGVAVLDCSAS